MCPGVCSQAGECDTGEGLSLQLPKATMALGVQAQGAAVLGAAEVCSGASLWGLCPWGRGSQHPAVPRLCLLSQAKLGDEILDYRDLAALPKNKAIYNIDRPDLISYSPYISHSSADRQSYGEVRPSPVPGASPRGHPMEVPHGRHPQLPFAPHVHGPPKAASPSVQVLRGPQYS